MASIEEQLRNARTLEDIVNLLTILFANLNNQNEQYYDMFLNPVPMDLDLERYDENGELVTVVHPNVAKMRMNAYSGDGNPNGQVTAGIGSLYINLSSPYDLYYKSRGSDAQGWVGLWDKTNLNYLEPTGDASQLKNLNMNSAGSGVLATQYGGTGDSGTLTGLVKANGASAYSAAVDGVDYLGPTGFTGMITYFPFDITAVENSGWLLCNGALYTAQEYGRLCARLGNKYKITAGTLSGTFYAYKNGTTIVYLNTDEVSTSTIVYSAIGVASLLVITEIGTNTITLSDGNTYTYSSTDNVDGATYADGDEVDGVTVFRVPNLIGRYIKGGVPANVGSVGAGHVGTHSHTLSGSTEEGGAHTHNKGKMNITGYICASEKVFKNKQKDPPASWGAFSQWKANVVSGSSPNNTFDNNIWRFNARDSWTGETSEAPTHTHTLTGSTNAAGSGTNDVDHLIMVPVIKY